MTNASSECENIEEHCLVRKHGMEGFLLGSGQGCVQTMNRQSNSFAAKA